jgi:hypothetical protein
MFVEEIGTHGIRGMFRDVLRDESGRVVWDRGWQSNVVVDTCRPLLASLVDGVSVSVSEITALRVGFGLTSWDTAGTPAATAATTELVDDIGTPASDPLGTVPPPRNSHAVVRSNLALTFIDSTGNPTATPTNRLQIFASLGPGVPPWPDATHPAPTMREFGLVAMLNGAEVLLNYRTHPAIAKDPVSTLQRTIWLIF